MLYVSLIYSVTQKAAYIVGFALLSSVLLGLILTIGYCVFTRQWQFATIRLLFSELFIIFAPFSTIGIISGVLTGLSRTPAVSALIPAVLTFVGAVVAFQIAKTKIDTLVAALATICFAVFLLIGTLLGSAEREIYEARKNSLEQQFRDVETEFAVEQYRKGLGLPPGARRKTDASTTEQQTPK
jgi:hypothetical protein